MKEAFKKFFLFFALLVATLTLSPDVLGQSDSEQRAVYWKTQGYNFDPTYMTAWQMDQKVQDIKRAAYWKTQGYNFDPTYMTAWAMDQKVQDIKRAAYWKTQGYNFDPTYMTAWAMDQKVQDIKRAAYWKTQGYNFDPTYMTAWAMDQKVNDIQRAAYWKTKGYNFDSTYMTAWAMDAQVASTPHNPIIANAYPSTISTNFVAGQFTAPSTLAPIAPSSVYYPAVPTYVPSATAENGSYYGEPNQYGIPKTVFVNGYFRSDGTYVRSYYRSSPSR